VAPAAAPNVLEHAKVGRCLLKLKIKSRLRPLSTLAGGFSAEPHQPGLNQPQDSRAISYPSFPPQPSARGTGQARVMESQKRNPRVSQ